MSAPVVGIVGFGFMGRVHAAAWRAVGAELGPVLMRPGHGHADELAAAGCTPVTDVDEFLAAVDVVDICLPTALHREFALRAAEAGRPTLCEKPLALSTRDAHDIVEAFERAGVPLQVAHVLRFDAEYAAARRVVASGDLGEVAVLRLTRSSFAPDRGAGSWFSDDAQSGGIVFDLMIHDLDYALWVAGPVATAFGRVASGGAGHAIAILRHESGALSHIEASWANPDQRFDTAGEIAGTRGLLRFSSETSRTMSVRLRAEPEAQSTGLGDIALRSNPFEAQAAEFLAAVWSGGAQRSTPRDGLAAVALAEAVRRSIFSGRPERPERPDRLEPAADRSS